jgi:hypothetical protein
VRLALVGHGAEVAEDVSCARTFAEEGDTFGITTKAADVAVNPFYGNLLISQTWSKDVNTRSNSVEVGKD